MNKMYKPPMAKKPNGVPSSAAPHVPKKLYDSADMDRFLVAYFNKDPARAGKKWALKDLSTMSQDEFFRSILFLLPEAPQDVKNALRPNYRGNSAPLHRMNSCSDNFRIFNPNRSRQAYLALKKLFPDGCELLSPAIVANPMGDPARTKQVLKYLAFLGVQEGSSCAEFGDMIDAQLDVLDQKREKQHMLTQTVEQINTRSIQLDDWQQQVISIRNEMQSKQDEVLQLGGKINRLTDLSNSTKQEFVEKERDVQRVRNQIEHTKSKISDAEKLLVDDVSRIMDKNERERQLVEEYSKEIEDRRKEVEMLRERRNLVSSVGESARRIGDWLSELALNVQSAGNDQSDLSALKEEVEQLKVEKSELITQINAFKSGIELTGDVSGASADAQKLVHAIEHATSMLQKLDDNTKELQKQILQNKDKILEQEAQHGPIKNAWNDFKTELNELQECCYAMIQDFKRVCQLQESVEQDFEGEVKDYLFQCDQVAKRKY